MQDRKALLENLLRLEDPRMLNKIMADLKAYGWDSDEDLVTITRKDIIFRPGTLPAIAVDRTGYL